jgi:hypothetical protein
MSNHHLDFSAEDIETFLGGVLSRHQGGECDTEDGGEGPGTTEDESNHTHNNNTSSGNSISEEQKAAVRTERKRCREKQRRSDVNRQFTELNAALRKVESESSDWARHTYTSTTNRADLIARSIYILNSIHESNESRKRRVIELERDLELAKKAGEETAAKLKEQIMAPQQMGGGRMIMMVPMMIGGDSAPAPAMPYGQMPYFMPQPSADGTAISMPPQQSIPMPPYMIQHMMSVAAHQQHQTMMQPANPIGVMDTSAGSGGDMSTGDHGKKKAATEDYTNNVAHLA